VIIKNNMKQLKENHSQILFVIKRKAYKLNL